MSVEKLMSLKAKLVDLDATFEQWHTDPASRAESYIAWCHVGNALAGLGSALRQLDYAIAELVTPHEEGR